ncbi:MAG TPA: hypothetical protein VLD86_11195 [Ilumatobacteraceae bacterium]|nr:hypothetical protein [Ilumatobacteraceae bacterium]
MSYASITVASDLTVADYHTIGAHLGPDPADGLVTEVAGATDGGLHVITVWDSKAQHERFIAERLVPAFQAAGIRPGELRFTDVDVDTIFVRDR